VKEETQAEGEGVGDKGDRVKEEAFGD